MKYLIQCKSADMYVEVFSQLQSAISIVICLKTKCLNFNLGSF